MHCIPESHWPNKLFIKLRKKAKSSYENTFQAHTFPPWGQLTSGLQRLFGLRYAAVPAFMAIKSKYSDVLGGAPPGLPTDRSMQLKLETGDAPMPQSRPVKRLLDGELAELRAQFRLVDLLDLD